MAPGCTSIQQEKDQKLVQFEVKNCSEFADLFDYTAPNSENNTNLTEITKYYVCYDALYLDQIPLPPSPSSSLLEDEAKQQIVDFVVDQTKLISQPRASSTSANTTFSLDTIDSFEILEQTIMKQKKLSKSKNTDLRLKVLLKRTFNLVCEIMDHENGFDSDDACESSESISETKEARQSLGIDYEEEVEKNDDSSDDEDDTDAESDSDEDDDYAQESINYSKLISTQASDFQSIALKEYNFYELDHNRYENLNTDQVLDKTCADEHYMSLEPIVTYMEQQSNKN